MITAQSVRELLKDRTITRVAIIDDAFDEDGKSAPDAVQQETIHARLGEQQFSRALRRVKLAPDEPGGVTLAWLEEVRLASARESALRDLWEFARDTLGVGRVSRWRLDQFAKMLKDDLKLKVDAIGAKKARKGGRAPLVKPDTGLIFMDYQMDRPGEEMGALSSDVMSRVYEQFRAESAAPLVVLMSELELDATAVAAFRKGTALLSGMFYFVPKGELFQPERLRYRLAAYAKSLPTGQALQQYVQRVEDALDQVRDQVFREVRALSIADYAYLTTMRLHDDGQALGEYLMWLFTAHLAGELARNESVRQAEAQINALRFEDLPPTQSEPSKHLGTLYSSAVLRPADPLPATYREAGTYLQFGDLFRAPETDQVWLCITPACDLAYSTGNPSGRPFLKKRSIFFVPGKLRPLAAPLKEREERLARTELVVIDGEAQRIIWDQKYVDRCEYGELGPWLQSRGNLQRIATLQTPFALEVQRAFAADLTRIGMPVAPPFYENATVTFTCLGPQGRVALTPGGRPAYVVGNRLMLGERLMDELPDLLGRAEDLISQRLAGQNPDADPDQYATANAALEMIRGARANADQLVGLRGPFAIPPAGDHAKPRGRTLLLYTEADERTLPSSIPLWIQISRDREAEAGGRDA